MLQASSPNFSAALLGRCINNVSPQARKLGVKPLTPEESENLTLGFGARVTDNFNVTFDFYDIAITDRIVISNRVTPPPPDDDDQLEFFTNSIDTKTSGVDLVLDFTNMRVGPGALGLSLAGNINLRNERAGAIPQVNGTDVIDATQEALFFTSRPKLKFVLGTSFDMKKLNLSLNNTYFGKTEFKQAGMDIANLKTVFDAKVVTDLGVTYDLLGNVSLAANINKLFDVLPKWNFEALTPAGTAILNDPAQTKVQTNLITFNGRYDVMTYDAYHFSQLGRIYNLSLAYKF